MNDEEILQKFAHEQFDANFKASFNASNADKKRQFSELVEKANKNGLDWYFIGNRQLRLGTRDIGAKSAERCIEIIRLNVREGPINPQGLSWSSDLQNKIETNTNPNRRGHWPVDYQAQDKKQQTAKALNTILYGPPGTGKTWSVVVEAMVRIDPCNEGKTYRELKTEFDRLVGNGQIAMITFHQSYGYEDFVQGIKPTTTEDGQIAYDVYPGILMRIAQRALCRPDQVDFESTFAEFVKEFEPNGTIELSLYRQSKKCKFTLSEDKQSITAFPDNGANDGYKLKKTLLNEIWDRRGSINRPVDIQETNRTYCWAILNKLITIAGAQPAAQEPVPHVLIIDEINRGNISRIFGELITLIEEDKRIGEPHEIRVQLPNDTDSNKGFGLPSNLYIIGTMNTADRSLAQLDIALRRRFDFVPMMPDLKVLENLKVEGVSISEMLGTINERIAALYDRDHTIGHAYFTSLMDSEGKCAEGKSLFHLAHIFRNRIIPLLEEYFFEDWGKIRLVLGDNQKKNQSLEFVKSNEIKVELFGREANAQAFVNNSRQCYEINKDAFDNPLAYISIYDNSEESKNEPAQ